MKRNKMMVVACVAAFGGLAFTLWAADVAIGQIPAAAREALQKLAGDNKIVAVESEKEHGIQVYEAKWVNKGVRTEAEVTADGVLLEMEESVKPDSVPEAVRKAAGKAFSGAAKLRYEKHTAVFYEVKGQVNGKKKEISVSASGKLMGGKHDDADDDDDDDDDDK